ncbi:unnamed protein product [Brassica oleracea]
MANWLLRLPPSLFATISFAVSRFFFLFLSYYQFQLHRSLRSSLMVCSSALGRSKSLLQVHLSLSRLVLVV